MSAISACNSKLYSLRACRDDNKVISGGNIDPTNPSEPSMDNSRNRPSSSHVLAELPRSPH